MKSYISDIIPKIKRFSKGLEEKYLLKNNTWRLFTDGEVNHTYIFRKANELLISSNGIVNKGKWEHVADNTLLIEVGSGSYLFKLGFFDDKVLALQLDDSKNEFVFFINDKVIEDFKSIDATNKYLGTYIYTSANDKVEKNSQNVEEEIENKISYGNDYIIIMIVLMALIILAFLLN